MATEQCRGGPSQENGGRPASIEDYNFTEYSICPLKQKNWVAAYALTQPNVGPPLEQ